MRTSIPESLKRKVRQRCRFGCVICGSPIYDYEHIEDYSLVREHTYDNLVLLCPNCHRKKTNGQISRESVVKARQESEQRASTSPDVIPAQEYSLDVGGNIVKTFKYGCVFQIWDFGHFDLCFDGNHHFIDAIICNENAGNAIEIEKNVYIMPTTTWDVEYVGGALTFRNAPRKIFASIKFDAENKNIMFRCDTTLRNGVRIRVKDDGIYANNNLLAAGNIIENCGAALTIGAGYPAVPVEAYNASFYRNTVVGTPGISALDCINCCDNIMHKCGYAFFWTLEYLDLVCKK